MQFSLAKLFGITIRESATDGSDFTNPDADYRRLFLGEDGQLHVKDSAGAVTDIGIAGASGALVFLEAHTAASSASLDFTTCISATYDDYLIEVVGIVPATNGAFLRMRMGTGGGPSYDAGTNYNWTSWRWIVGANAIANIAGDNQITIDGGAAVDGASNTATNGGINATYHLLNPGSGSMYPTVIGHATFYNSATAYEMSQVQARYTSTTAITAFQFLFSTGNISSGTIRVYGIAKS